MLLFLQTQAAYLKVFSSFLVLKFGAQFIKIIARQLLRNVNLCQAFKISGSVKSFQYGMNSTFVLPILITSSSPVLTITPFLGE
jgi:hypothetical protein